MINGLEGIPGSGKSYEAVAYHVLPMLQAGRKVITNLPLIVEMFASIDPSYLALIELRTKPRPVLGTWDANRVDDNGNGNAFELFEGDQAGTAIPPRDEVTVFGHVWDYYSTWKHPETGQGPVFIVDECHVALPKLQTDKQVIQWFKLHRHFNVDVLLMTQSFRDIEQSIAGLMAMLVVCRKADILGKKDCYIRKVKAGYRGAVISTEERPYKEQYFRLYKSHTQGNSVAESAAGDVVPFIVKFRRYSRIFWVFTLVACVYAFWPAGDKKPVKQASRSVQQSSISVPVAGNALQPAQQAAKAQESGPAHDAPAQLQEPPEPFAGKGLHLTGQLSMRGRIIYTFAISVGAQRIGTTDSVELAQVGYRFEPLTACVGYLRWANDARAVTCDAPAVPQATNDRPVVVAVDQEGRRVASSISTPSQTVPMPTSPAVDPHQISQAELAAQLRQEYGHSRSGHRF